MKNKQKHLEFIQTAINRMASNLFFLRGWTITLVAVLLALFVKDNSLEQAMLIIVLILIFWVMDGYFLSQERLFRDLYNKVRNLKEKDINFSMNTNPFKKFKKNSLIYSMFSSTLIIFYLPLIIITLITALILY